ncbi:hypothetical protein BCR35DRAFT_350109, partial [Leucosporidium creatinivorum]
MAPTLPTELIKHILELLYDNVRTPRYNPTTPFDEIEGEKLAFAFRPCFLVSKTFYALALPIAARHLLPPFGAQGALEASDKLEQARLHLLNQGLGQAVESIHVPAGLTRHREQDVFLAFPRLRTLYSFGIVQNLHLLPKTLTILTLEAKASLDSGHWAHLGEAAPHLTSLSLKGKSRYSGDHGPLHLYASPKPVDPGWRLKHLALNHLSGSEEQALAFITASASTLESLSFDCHHPMHFSTIHPGSVLSNVTTPLPLLRRLCLGRVGDPFILPPACSVLDRTLLPNLEELQLYVRRSSIHQLLTISPTIVTVLLTSSEEATSPIALDILKTFVAGHSGLRLLSLDCAFLLRSIRIDTKSCRSSARFEGPSSPAARSVRVRTRLRARRGMEMSRTSWIRMTTARLWTSMPRKGRSGRTFGARRRGRRWDSHLNSTLLTPPKSPPLLLRRKEARLESWRV